MNIGISDCTSESSFTVKRCSNDDVCVEFRLNQRSSSSSQLDVALCVDNNTESLCHGGSASATAVRVCDLLLPSSYLRQGGHVFIGI